MNTGRVTVSSRRLQGLRQQLRVLHTPVVCVVCVIERSNRRLSAPRGWEVLVPRGQGGSGRTRGRNGGPRPRAGAEWHTRTLRASRSCEHHSVGVRDNEINFIARLSARTAPSPRRTAWAKSATASGAAATRRPPACLRA